MDVTERTTTPTSCVWFLGSALMGGVVLVWAPVWFSMGWLSLLATLLVTGAVFLWGTRNPMDYRLGFALAGTAFAWLPILLIVSICPSVGADVLPLPFHGATWRSGSMRNLMVDSLVDSRQLIGLDRSEVRSLLGEPDDHFSDEDYYILGHAGAVTIDRSFLVIDYDSQGCVLFASLMDT